MSATYSDAWKYNVILALVVSPLIIVDSEYRNIKEHLPSDRLSQNFSRNQRHSTANVCKYFRTYIIYRFLKLLIVHSLTKKKRVKFTLGDSTQNI